MASFLFNYSPLCSVIVSPLPAVLCALIECGIAECDGMSMNCAFRRALFSYDLGVTGRNAFWKRVFSVSLIVCWLGYNFICLL